LLILDDDDDDDSPSRPERYTGFSARVDTHWYK